MTLTAQTGNIGLHEFGATDSTVEMAAYANITLWDLTSAESTVTMTADHGNIGLSNAGITDSDVTLWAYGNIMFIDFNAADSDVTFTAKTGDIGFDDLAADESTVDFTAGGSIAAAINAPGADNHYDIVLTNGSDLTFVAGADITAQGIFADESSMKLDTASPSGTGGDIRFDYLDAMHSIIVFDADGSIGTLTGVNPVITFDENDVGNGSLLDNALLQLAAGQDIGAYDVRLIADVPALITLYVPNVTNYYIDALDLPPGVVPADAILSGTDIDGNIVFGDYLKNINWQELYAAVDAQTPEELAEWIFENIAREDWAALLNGATIKILIQTGDFTSYELASWIDEYAYRSSAIRRMLRDDIESALDIANKVIAATIKKETVKIHGVYTERYAMDDDEALEVLAAMIEQDAVDALGETLGALLTEEQIQALYAAAVAQSEYPKDATYFDAAARTFTMDIGISTGEGYISNEGDIFITQHNGDLTAGYIQSERGDVAITVENGSIYGIADPSMEHILGRNVTLWAMDNIGSVAQALIIEQQANRPVIVWNIDQSIYGVPAEYVLVQVPLLSEDGLPVVDEDGNAVLVWTLKVVVRYDFLRVDYPAEATHLDATGKTGMVNIEEMTGDMGIGAIEAGLDVQLVAPGSILDMRTQSQSGLANITGGNAILYAGTGCIGTTDRWIDMAVAFVTTATAHGNICLADTGDMLLLVDSILGQVYAQAELNLLMINFLSRTESPIDLTLGYVTAGYAAFIYAQGAILEGDRLGRTATITADTIELVAMDGGIGTADNAFEVDTQNGLNKTGTFAAYGSELYIAEVSGDMVLLGLESIQGDIELTVPGNIEEVDALSTIIEDAAEAQRIANDAQTRRIWHRPRPMLSTRLQRALRRTMRC